MRIAYDELALRVAKHGKSELMDTPMVSPADKSGVIERCFAALEPMDQVMSVHDLIATAWELAAVIAQSQGATECRRN